MPPKKRKSIVKARGWSDDFRASDQADPASPDASEMSISSDEGADPLSSSNNKRQKLESPRKSPQKMKSAKSPPKPKMTFAQATTKTLSKFAQNLVKPGYLAARAQLVVEPPEIPLNDEFLQAFGRSVTSSAPKKLPSSSTRISADVSSEDDYSESDGEEVRKWSEQSVILLRDSNSFFATRRCRKLLRNPHKHRRRNPSGSASQTSTFRRHPKLYRSTSPSSARFRICSCFRVTSRASRTRGERT